MELSGCGIKWKFRHLGVLTRERLIDEVFDLHKASSLSGHPRLGFVATSFEQRLQDCGTRRAQ